MRAMLVFIRTTVVGGVVFLLPFGIILMVVEKLYAAVRPVGRAVHETLLPGSPSNLLPIAFAILILLILAFLAGVFARSLPGRRLFRWLEAAFLTRLPPYTIFRQMIDDYSGSTENPAFDQTRRVVMIHFDDYSCPAFLIEKRPEGGAVVFIPGSPSATSGNVAIVSEERIEDTNLTAVDVTRSLRRLGLGLAEVPR